MADQDFQLPPSYREVAAAIRRAIEEGLYPYGTKLPSAKEIAREYGVTVATVQRAMALLAEQGMIKGRQGLGRYVTWRTPG